MKDQPMTSAAKRDGALHYNMAFIGGFLGLYPILNFADWFGSAQTANMIYIVTALLGGSWAELGLRVLGLLIYLLAVVLATWIPKHTCWDRRCLALAVDGIAAVIMVLIPKSITPLVGLYPTFFAMAFQWCSFSGAYGYTSATIFSTNNVRQFASALVEVFLNKDQSFRLKARFFGNTLLAFHLGVAACYLLWRFTGEYVSLFVVAPILTAKKLLANPE